MARAFLSVGSQATLAAGVAGDHWNLREPIHSAHLYAAVPLL